MSESSAEKNLLRAVTRWRLNPGPAAPDIVAHLHGVNWHRLLWLGRQHGVLLFLHDALKTPELAARAPVEVVAQLEQFFEVHQLRALGRVGDLCPVHDLFERAAIPALLMDRRYAAPFGGERMPDPFERGVGVRYAVPPADRMRAESLLTAAQHPIELHPEKLIVEGRIPVLLNQGLAAHPAAARLWQRSETITVAGRALRCPALMHWLLHLIQNTPDRANVPLGRAWEIAGLTQALSPAGWQELQAEAAHFALQDHVPNMIAASHRALHLSPPSFLPAPFDDAASPRCVEADTPASPNLLTPFLPTPELVVTRMLALAETKPHDLVCDLGCGDGRIVITAAREFGARGHGVDIDPRRIAEAQSHADKHGVLDRVSFAVGDMFGADLREASVVSCYLLPEVQPLVLKKLRAEARPGTRIVSHEFVFPGWPPEKTELIRARPNKISQIYLWRLP